MNKIIKDAFMLTVITLISGLLLGAVYEITKEPIAKQQELAKQQACKKVFAEASSFEEILMGDMSSAEVLEAEGYIKQNIEECMTALDAAGNEIGYVITVTSKEGYGDDITFSVGIKKDGTVNGIELLKISETAGLGMKAKESVFKDQFANKKVEKFAYTKTGAAMDHEIDALSGATITTNAITNGVNAAICMFRDLEGGN